jgi:quinol-cytochrome oxidoreductase complex cytochrome b subunit
MVMLHLLLVQKFGMSVPPSVEKEGPRFGSKVKFFPNYLLRDVMTWSVALTALLILSVIHPAELGTKADPFGSTPAGIKPEWYFLAQFQTLRLLPSTILHIDGELIGVLGFGLAGGLWLALPLLESHLGREGGRWARVAVLAGLVYLASTTLYAYFTT